MITPPKETDKERRTKGGKRQGDGSLVYEVDDKRQENRSLVLKEGRGLTL